MYFFRVLLQGADLTLAYGRRYGLVGRNGLGKSTLLRMISGGQLRIPSHISILHVEQEVLLNMLFFSVFYYDCNIFQVVGDNTLAIDSVLECDTVRAELLKKEKEISAAINAGYVISNI